MIGFLRFVGLMNAAVWFGAAIFFTFGIGAAPFSPEMKELLGPKNAPYFSGAIAQIFIARYFHLQLACGLVALLHLLAEWIYFGRTPQQASVGLLMILVVIGLAGGYWIQPRLKELHRTKYLVKTTQSQHDAADHSFRVWHGASQGLNLLMLAGLGLYLWRVANPSDSTRFLSATKFRG